MDLMDNLEMALGFLVGLADTALILAGASVGVNYVLGFNFIAEVGQFYMPLAGFLGLGAFVGALNTVSYRVRGEGLVEQ